MENIPADVPVYAICGSGCRSSVTSSILLRHGRSNVINVNAGMNAWKARHFPVVKDPQMQTLVA